ncbi:hypothetical protein B0T14DRAFT_518382 [Immersiella caudata]|uniref:Uncharacterized protein n=1 Tax=Immersiella caudata TaxID=314043 RepID=A0AA39WP47_9PEZI|nr:hypothetical protein B0T14DRAFT_518382 [Immersiella caudata]
MRPSRLTAIASLWRPLNTARCLGELIAIGFHVHRMPASAKLDRKRTIRPTLVYYPTWDANVEKRRPSQCVQWNVGRSARAKTDVECSRVERMNHQRGRG